MFRQVDGRRPDFSFSLPRLSACIVNGRCDAAAARRFSWQAVCVLVLREGVKLGLVARLQIMVEDVLRV
jgi:hypothetical protein